MGEAERIRAASLAIPPIGAGNIGYAPSVVAKVLTEEVANYIETHSDSCITDVRFVMLDSDRTLLQVTDYITRLRNTHHTWYYKQPIGTDAQLAVHDL